MKNKRIIREIRYGSEDYRAELSLRNELLRRPIGKSLYDEDLRFEKGMIHIGAFLDERLIGTLLLRVIDSVTLQMRQVAVEPPFQHQGIGREMVLYAEYAARRRGYRRIQLHARLTAENFYQRLGYEPTSAVFFEVTLPHRKMEKLL